MWRQSEDRCATPVAEANRPVVWYVAVTDFPKGLGSTTRSRSICRALHLAGCDVHLLIPHAIGHASNVVASGRQDDISYEYLTGTTERPSTPLRVAVAKVRSAVRLTRRLWRERQSVRFLVLYNPSWVDYWPLIGLSRILRLPVVVDFTDEWHDPSASVRSLGRVRYVYQLVSRQFERIIFGGSNRIIVVSRHLERRLAAYRHKLCRIAMVFDSSRFEEAMPERVVGPEDVSIVYAGSLSHTEGTHILLQAFARLGSSVDRPVRLTLVGRPAHAESVEQYRSLSNDLGVGDAVRFMDPVDSIRYASVLRGADVLVAPRTTTLASRAGFPYKIGEYLASGTPVVTTRFGDIEEYFVANRDCVMTTADDPAAFAVGMQWVIEHPADAAAMARQGQATVRNRFDTRHVAAHLLETLLGADRRHADGSA